MDIHFCPYILTGLFDPILAKEVHVMLNTYIGKAEATNEKFQLILVKQ